MPRRLGTYTLGHYLTLDNYETHQVWNPLLKGYEKWEFSYLDTSKEGDSLVLEQTLQGMSMTYNQVLHGLFPLSERVAALERLSVEFAKNIENLIAIVSMEVSKPVTLARGECARTLQTIQATIDLGKSLLSGNKKNPSQGVGNFFGKAEALPRGIALGITPFNFPMNLCMHKIAPAILAGTPLVWRPSSKCLLSNLALVDVLHATKIPSGLIAFLPMTHDTFWKLLSDERVSCVSFTGSAPVGWKIHEKYLGPTILELGGSAPVYLDNSKLENLEEIAGSAFSFAGQSCISAQNLFIHENVYDDVVPKLKQIVAHFRVGKAQSEEVLTSGVIDEAAMKRILGAIQAEKDKGAEIFSAPFIDEQIQNFVPPTLIFGPSKKMQEEEIFGPVLNVFKIMDEDDFIVRANHLPHRLQAAVFSEDENILNKCKLELDYGGVALNSSPSVRVDALPYGGRGLAGLGVENPYNTWSFFAPEKTFYSKKSTL